MKKSFSLIEIIFSILLVSIILSQANFQNNLSKIKLAKDQIILHLKYTRYIAMLDDKYDYNDDKWFRKRWSLKFFNCRSDIGGVYYVIYSNEDKNGAISKEETLKDPLTNNHIYSYQCSKDSLYDKSKFVLLTQEYEINDILISCNKTTTIGQFSFDKNGDVYTKLSTDDENDYKLEKVCTIQLFDKYARLEEIKIYPTTGFIE